MKPVVIPAQLTVAMGCATRSQAVPGDQDAAEQAVIYRR
jgi:hypothetical protein